MLFYTSNGISNIYKGLVSKNMSLTVNERIQILKVNTIKNHQKKCQYGMCKSVLFVLYNRIFGGLIKTPPIPNSTENKMSCCTVYRIITEL